LILEKRRVYPPFLVKNSAIKKAQHEERKTVGQ
jgi:hypothetical protein